ncbi:MAG: hypothetical protein EAZ97_08165 [Bacteroidetes bacterium]|nr:MAG: hypothetical protein EAZ97_08165 [Bacteroidota bacterium]
MISWIKPIAILFVLFFYAFLIQAQNLRFKHLETENGLSNSSVRCILQDKEGFMWFGTENGLNRYDGYDWTVFRHQTDDSASLSNNFIRAMIEDRTGNLWVATQDGLNCFNKKTNHFTVFKHKENENSIKNNNILAILEDSKGFIWIALDGGLNKFNPKTGFFELFLKDSLNPKSLNDNRVRSLYEDQDQNLWIGTFEGGLNLFDKKTNTFQHFKNKKNNSMIRQIIPAANNKLWLATRQGLILFDKKTKTHKKYLFNNQNFDNLMNNELWSICEDQGVLWIGTENGLQQFDPKTEKFNTYKQQNYNTYSLSSSVVYSVEKDRSGVLWIGTAFGGLNYLDRQFNQFSLYQNQSGNPNSLSNNMVRGILEDSEGLIWIATEGGGLNVFDRKNNQWKNFRHQPNNNNSLSSDKIWSLFEDKNKNLWIGTLEDGLALNLFNKKKNSFSTAKHFKKKIERNRQQAILSIKGQEDNLLVSTWLNIWNFDPKKHVFSPFTDKKIPTNLIESLNILYLDKKNNVWVASDKGLVKFNKDGTSKVYEQKNGLTYNQIRNIHEDKKGIIWLGTENGLSELDPKTEKFTNYQRKDGLLAETIYGILEDSKGNLWLSSNQGISFFDMQTRKFENYNQKDGLQQGEFNAGSFLKLKSGEMAFGGRNGLSIFNPNTVNRKNNYLPPVVITDFQIFNQSIKIAKDSMLKQDIRFTKEIILPYTASVFSFTFAALNYTVGEKNQYAYKLEGFEDDWNNVGTRRLATYTKIPAGEYFFKVKASNNDLIWNEQGTVVKITIIPPFWEENWFKIMFFLCILGIILAIFYYRISRIRKQKEILEREVIYRTAEIMQQKEEIQAQSFKLEVQSNKLQSLNDLKDRLFSIISHDLRNVMGGIKTEFNSLENALMKGNIDFDDILTSIQDIKKSTKNTDFMLENLLEWAKQAMQDKNMKLKWAAFDFFDLIEEIINLVKPQANAKNIDLINLVPTNGTVLGDHYKLNIVLRNLILNAIKFTNKNGKITILREEIEDTVKISVIDTGIGISNFQKNQIQKNICESTFGTEGEKGIGIGLQICANYLKEHQTELLIESEVGKGSEFYFFLPN